MGEIMEKVLRKRRLRQREGLHCLCRRIEYLVGKTAYVQNVVCSWAIMKITNEV